MWSIFRIRTIASQQVWISNIFVLLSLVLTTTSQYTLASALVPAPLVQRIHNDSTETFNGGKRSVEWGHLHPSRSPLSSSNGGSAGGLLHPSRNVLHDSTSTSTTTSSTTAETTTPPGGAQEPDSAVIVGSSVGAMLLLLLLAVLFVNREALLSYCKPGHPVEEDNEQTIVPYVHMLQETSGPEDTGPVDTLREDTLRDHTLREDTGPEDTESLVDKEFKLLLSYHPVLNCNIARLKKNVIKNRYADFMPYDFNIVNLKSGNYMNASHIEGNMIVTQDPLMMQVDEFWQLVWEHNTSIIVRLSTDQHDRAPPAAVYLPPHRWVVGLLEVTTLEEHYAKADYTRSVIRINYAKATSRKKPRDIYHYHLGCWQTGRLPPVRQFMLALQTIRKQKKLFDQLGFTRTLIHCGCGSVRTGTFLAVWLLLDSIDAGEDDISVLRTVMRLREQRGHVVNRLELYKFIYTCLEFYKANVDTPRSDSPYETVVGVGNNNSSNSSNNNNNNEENNSNDNNNSNSTTRSSSKTKNNSSGSRSTNGNQRLSSEV